MRAVTLISLLTTLTQGCATASDYGKVYGKLTDTRRQLRQAQESHDAEVEALRASLAESREHEAELTSTVTRQQNEAFVSGAELEELRVELESSNDTLRGKLKTLSAQKGQADAQARQYRRLLEQFKGMIDAGKLRVKIEAGRMVVELPSDVLFASGSATLSEEGRIAVEQVAGVLKDLRGKSFQVEGHTDNVPIHNDEFASNWQLASARAQAVVGTLLTAGMPPHRVSAASFAEYRPVRSNRSETGKAANRRIEIVLVPDLTGVPDARTLEDATSRATRPAADHAG